MVGDKVVYESTGEECYIARVSWSRSEGFHYNLEDEDGNVLAQNVHSSEIRLVD